MHKGDLGLGNFGGEARVDIGDEVRFQKSNSGLHRLAATELELVRKAPLEHSEVAP